MTVWHARLNRNLRSVALLWPLFMAFTLVPCIHAQKVAFREAMELAVKHSASIGIAEADQMRAQQSFLETRNAYIPQITFGSGIAKTWGYPMSIEGSAPSLFNVTSQSVLFNMAQQKFLRAANQDWHAASLLFADQRQATLLEAALTYLQLDTSTAKFAAAQQAVEEANQLETVSRERLEEGIDSKVDVARAALQAARARMLLADARSAVDLLRERLAQLTGLDPREVVTDPASIPLRPNVDAAENLAQRAMANSPAVKAADEKAASARTRAKGEHAQLYPSIDLVGNYGLFTKYNNLDLLFPTGQFSRNNATVGIAIKFPVLSAAQRSHAEAADADALRAQKQAQATREQVALEALKLKRAVDGAAAARDVAQLEHELSQAEVEAAQARIHAGNATIKDEQAAQVQVSEKHAAYLDAQYEFDRLRLQLLRVTGDLEKWALP